MKYFPIVLHVILAVAAIGLAVVGAHEEGLRPLIQGGLTGLAIGLGVTCFIRIIVCGGDW